MLFSRFSPFSFSFSLMKITLVCVCRVWPGVHGEDGVLCPIRPLHWHWMTLAFLCDREWFRCLCDLERSWPVCLYEVFAVWWMFCSQSTLTNHVIDLGWPWPSYVTLNDLDLCVSARCSQCGRCFARKSTILLTHNDIGLCVWPSMIFAFMCGLERPWPVCIYQVFTVRSVFCPQVNPH